MAFFNAQPVTAGTSAGFSVTADVRVAAPFTASNITWVEVENSTSEAWSGFYLLTWSIQVRSITLVAIGAASSEVIIASAPTIVDSKGYTRAIWVPVPIASGTRIAVGASASAALTVGGQIVGIPSSNFDAEPSFTIMDSGPYDLENDTATYARFPTFDPGATAHTKGSYTEISKTTGNGVNNVLNGDSLAQAYDYLGILIGDNFNLTQTAHADLIDVAHGPAASEVVVLGDCFVRQSAWEVGSGTVMPLWTPWGRASGDRISARSQCSITDATDRIKSALLFGVR